jgi:hypothetical protein
VAVLLELEAQKVGVEAHRLLPEQGILLADLMEPPLKVAV